MSVTGTNRGRIKQIFAQKIEASPIVALVNKIGVVLRSDVKSERYAVPFATPVFKERAGATGYTGVGAYLFDVINKTYEAGVKVEDEDNFFDQVDIFDTTFETLADRAAELAWNLFVAEMVNGNASTNPSYDGANFYSTTHSIGDSGTQSNNVSSATSGLGALNVSDTANVTPEEFADIATRVVAHMMSFKDDKGQPMNRMLRDFLVVVPPAMFGAGITAAHANNLTGGKSNYVTSIQAGGYNIEVVVEPTLSTSTVGFVHAVVPERRPFMLQVARDFRAFYLGEESEHYIHTGEKLAKADWMGRAGRGEPLRSVRFTID